MGTMARARTCVCNRACDERMDACEIVSKAHPCRRQLSRTDRRA
jgi:hypothetical protein